MVLVVAAVFTEGSKVMVARRKPGGSLPGHWEFPGGKIEPGETPQQALQREIKEEFAIDIEVGDFIATNQWNSDDKTISLSAYFATGEWRNLQLLDHDRIDWVEYDTWKNYKMAPADIPLIEQVWAILRV